MKNFLARKVDTIFMMLGNSCNLNCVYCLQHPLVHHQIATNINPEIYDFIRQVSEENDGNICRLHFYGGEPLIYYNQIKEIVKNTESIPNIRYTIVTNGKLLTDDKVEFFNKYDFQVAISWDGKNVLKTRHFDAFDPKKPLRRRIMRLNKLTVTGVLSSEVYPLDLISSIQEVMDEYYNLNKKVCWFNLDEVFDTGFEENCRYIIDDIDLDRVYKEMTELTEYFIDTFANNKIAKDHDLKIMYIRSIVQRIDYYINHTDEILNKVLCRCTNGYKVLNLDLNGNLYSCHNTSDVVANINDEYVHYLSKILQLDNTKTRMRTRCKDCPVVGCCNGGCKLVTDEVLDQTYCDFKKAMYIPVLEGLRKYGALLNG